MRSIKEQREMTIHIEHAELLDWAERARKLLVEAYARDSGIVVPSSTFVDALLLLKELPEE